MAEEQERIGLVWVGIAEVLGVGEAIVRGGGGGIDEMGVGETVRESPASSSIWVDA